MIFLLQQGEVAHLAEGIHLRFVSPSDLHGSPPRAAQEQSEGRNGKDDESNRTRDQTTNLVQGWQNHHHCILVPLALLALSSWWVLLPCPSLLRDIF
jgi:hypothetical protein